MSRERRQSPFSGLSPAARRAAAQLALLGLLKSAALIVMATALAQGITVTDESGRFEFVNPAFAQMLGRTQAEILSKLPLEITHPEDVPLVEKAQLDRKDGKTSRYEFRLTGAEGKSIHTLVSASPRCA